MKITLTGASGMLGSAILTDVGSFDFTVWSGKDVSDLDEVAIASNLISIGAKALINCAAFTNLEVAEQEPELDRAANALLPAKLAKACGQAGVKLIHFSSTGCYGDWKRSPYTDTDPCRPTTAHHRHKVEGEEAIRRSGCQHLILRTGWLYGGAAGRAKNFVWRRMIEAAAVGEIMSDAVQRGCPTSVEDVWKQVQVLIDQKKQGTFNIVAQGQASRLDYVRLIVSSAGLHTRIVPGPAFNRRAAVSTNETARNDRLQSEGLDRMPAWETSLQHYVRTLTRSPAWTSTVSHTLD